MSVASRVAIFKEAFGEAGADAMGILDSINKVNFDAYKFKVTANKPVYERRAALAAKVPKFWFNALNNCTPISAFIDTVDHECLGFLENVTIEHDEKDPRDFEMKFFFSPNNPYFKETVLSKKITCTPPSTSSSDSGPEPYDLEAPSYTSFCKITWTSDDKDLTKLAPRVNPAELEEFDEFSGMGSFFNWFKEEGSDDTFHLGEELLEWYSHALEYAAGLVEQDISEDEGEDGDDDDDEDESEDGNKEIDLESEDERPKKRSKA